MVNKEILDAVKTLVRRLRTRNPEEIAEALGVRIMNVPFVNQKGAFFIIDGHAYILVNSSLSPEMRAIVIAHELGHAVSHTYVFERDGLLLDLDLFNTKITTEYEANVFAAYLLIDEKVLIDYIKQGYDVDFIARAMHTNVNLIITRMTVMQQEKPELDFNIPYEPARDFLGTIDDDAGSVWL